MGEHVVGDLNIAQCDVNTTHVLLYLNIAREFIGKNSKISEGIPRCDVKTTEVLISMKEIAFVWKVSHDRNSNCM